MFRPRPIVPRWAAIVRAPLSAVLAATLPFAPFAALPSAAAATSYVIAAAGDIACDPAANSGAPQRCDQVATAALVTGLNPSAVLPLGDNQYEDGTLAAFQSVYQASWGQFKSKTHPVVGNHEYLTTNAAGYFGYFGSAAGSAGRGYYSWNLGSWHLIALNSECSHAGGCGSGSPQESWLRADLAAHPVACTLAYWHEPRWSSGPHGNATQMTTIWNDLVAAHADVVLAGHDHVYERFAPLGASGGTSPSGVQEFVVGTGGKNHESFSAAARTGEQVRSATAFGILKLSLNATSYSWRFMSAAGYSFSDSGSAACR